MSTAKGTFVFLAKYITLKYLQQELNDDLSVCVDKRIPCGLFITEGIKIYQWHYLQWRRSALWTSIKELFLLPKFDNSSHCD